MGQLHSSDAPLFMNEPDDSTQHLDVPVVPNAEVLRTDPSLRQNRSQLIKAPGFTFAAVLVLALGIGANTAVFSLVNTLFFAPPAYAKPHEMLQIFSQDKKDPKKFRGFSYPTYRDIREQNTVFSNAMA